MLVISCQEKKTTVKASNEKVEVEVLLSQKEVVLVVDAVIFQKDIEARADIQLIDVRTPEEYAEAHLRGATNYSVTDRTFQEKIAQLDINKPVYVYCKSGGRSARASERLKQFGFAEIRDLEGGITAWQVASLPTEK